jgi:hypothetical protein
MTRARQPRGPRAGQPSGVDYIAKARAAWGDALPDWVEELATYASAWSGTLAAQKIGYSPAVVTHVIANSYKGDLSAVEGKVRGALMGEEVICPVLGAIGRNVCLDEQAKPGHATSSIRSKVYRACRAGCVHSRLKRVEAQR